MIAFDYDKAEFYHVGWLLRRHSQTCRLIDRGLFLLIPLALLMIFRAQVTLGLLTLVVYIGVRITLWWRVGQHPSEVGQGDDRGGSMPALERSTADEVVRDDSHRP